MRRRNGRNMGRPLLQINFIKWYDKRRMNKAIIEQRPISTHFLAFPSSIFKTLFDKALDCVSLHINIFTYSMWYSASMSISYFSVNFTTIPLDHLTLSPPVSCLEYSAWRIHPHLSLIYHGLQGKFGLEGQVWPGELLIRFIASSRPQVLSYFWSQRAMYWLPCCWK